MKQANIFTNVDVDEHRVFHALHGGEWRSMEELKSNHSTLNRLIEKRLVECRLGKYRLKQGKED